MNENANLHDRARQLLAQSLIEGLGKADDQWLREHLAECESCRAEAATTTNLLSALRAVPVAIPSDLAARTQMRVRLRAAEIPRTAESGALLWILAAMSWVLGVATAPYVWRAFAWLGGNFGLPKVAIQVGFVLWWTIPAFVAAAILLHRRASASAR